MTNNPTSETANALVEQSSEMIIKILRKQMHAVLEQMEEEWRKEHDRANCLFSFVAAVVVGCSRGPIDREQLAALAQDYADKYGSMERYAEYTQNQRKTA